MKITPHVKEIGEATGLLDDALTRAIEANDPDNPITVTEQDVADLTEALSTLAHILSLLFAVDDDEE